MRIRERLSGIGAHPNGGKCYQREGVASQSHRYRLASAVHVGELM